MPGTRGAGLSPKLPIPTKLAFGLGTVAFGIKDQGFGALLMLYYNQVVGLPAAWVGAAIMVAMAVDGVLDPLIGHLSDHCKSPLGRRHPFMYASAIPVALSYLLLWAPPKAEPLWQCVWLVLTAIAVRVSVSLFEIPNTALTTEFTDDYEERTSLSSFRGVFYALGLSVMGVIVFKVFLVPTADGRLGQFNEAGYAAYSRVAALAMLLSILVSAWGTRKRGRALVSRAGEGPATLRGFLQGLREVVFDKVYASLLGTSFFFALAAGVNGTLVVYLQTYFWHMSASQMGTIAACSVIALILGVAVVVLTRRLDKKKVAVVLLGLTIVACTLLQLLGQTRVIPSTSALALPLLATQHVVALTCLLALTILVASMGADVGDYFRLKTGRHMEGLMFSLSVMINKAVSGVGVFIAGTLLTVVHFPEKAQPGEVGESVIWSLGWVYVLSIWVLCVISLLCLRAFPINRASHQRIQQQLRQEAAPAA